MTEPICETPQDELNALREEMDMFRREHHVARLKAAKREIEVLNQRVEALERELEIERLRKRVAELERDEMKRNPWGHGSRVWAMPADGPATKTCFGGGHA